MFSIFIFYHNISICRNIEELESNLEDVKKAVFGESDFKDHDIKKTKERIQELHRYM